MSKKDGLLAAIVIIIWGTNFMFIHYALSEVSPLVLGLLRFCSVIFPAILIFPKPDIRWYWLIAYGTFLSFGQFGLLFGSLAMGLSTSMASLLLQSQAFFTILIAAFLWHESIKINQWLAMLMAVMGLVLIGLGQENNHLPLTGLILILGAALSWAVGNVVVKCIGPTRPMPLVVWGNVISLILFALFSVWHDGFRGVLQQIRGMHWQGWIAVAYLSYMATFVGYGLWGILLSRYPAAKIAPLTLFIPVVAIMVGFTFLHELFNAWQWAGVIVIMLALIVHIFGSRFCRSNMTSGRSH